MNNPPDSSAVPPASPPSTAYTPTSRFAIVSLLFGIVAVLFLAFMLLVPYVMPYQFLIAVFAIIIGHYGLSDIARSQGWRKGRGLALAGLLLGYGSIALMIGFLVLMA